MLICALNCSCNSCFKMSSKMHLKLLEEINKLAEQFSRLSLYDEIRKLPVINNYKNVFVWGEMYKEVNELISVGVNKQEPTRVVMSLSDDEITEPEFSGDKIRRERLLCDDVNNNENNPVPLLSNTVSESKMSDRRPQTLESKILHTDVKENQSCLEKTSLKDDCMVAPDSNIPSNASNMVFKTRESNVPSTDSLVDQKTDSDKDNASNIIKPVNPIFNIEKDLQSTESINTKTISQKYYAVALPNDIECTEDLNNLVFTELKDALSFMKSWKGSRFKEFAKIEDALGYASQRLERAPPKVKLEDDGSTLRCATSQELCQLRKCIEKGEEIKFVSTVWNNPKILVGSCDTPSIMQEGMRYNALHVAAKSNKPYICQLILDTIENPKFLEQIYPLKTEAEREKIVQRLLDLYINTPDKKAGDTPLHYASKFGCVDCVKVLLAHPLCVPDRRNVAGFTPREIICNRLQPKSVTLVEDIEAAFNGLLYIPVLRSPENDVPPFVGKPCTCREIIQSSQGSGQLDAPSGMSLKAFVGPMAPEIAEQFYSVLKRPYSSKVLFNDTEELKLYDPEELKLISKIRFSDQEKGLERIGRWLAEDLKVPWQECFSFLNAFTNLSAEEGLRSLEAHFENQTAYDSNEEESLFLVHQYPSHINPLLHYVNVQLERKKEKEHNGDIYSTPPSSPVKNLEDCFTTPPASPSQYEEYCGSESDVGVFLQGSSVSKLDFDVLLAIGDASIDARQYPNVAKWKALVESKLEINDKNNPCNDSLSILTSVSLPRLHLCEKICTPKRSLLNKAFSVKNTS